MNYSLTSPSLPPPFSPRLDSPSLPSVSALPLLSLPPPSLPLDTHPSLSSTFSPPKQPPPSSVYSAQQHHPQRPPPDRNSLFAAAADFSLLRPPTTTPSTRPLSSPPQCRVEDCPLFLARWGRTREFYLVCSSSTDPGQPHIIYSAMYSQPVNQPGIHIPPGPPPNAQQPNPFGNALYGAGSGLIRGGLGAYGEKFLGSSSEFMQSNISKYFSNPQYYFQVNDQYVRNKLKVVLLPFLHRGHWTRITEPVGGRLSYKPPLYDINAPDLYIPFMAFGTYVVLAGFMLGLLGKFSPEALSYQFTQGLMGWVLEVAILKGLLYYLGSGEAPLLDVVAYGGYAFTGLSLAVLVKLLWGYSYYFMIPWVCVCNGIFLVKTMKRVLFTEMRTYERHSSRQHYLLLFVAIIQFPIFFWLSNIGA